MHTNVRKIIHLFLIRVHLCRFVASYFVQSAPSQRGCSICLLICYDLSPANQLAEPMIEFMHRLTSQRFSPDARPSPRSLVVKEKIHPRYVASTVKCACGNTFRHPQHAAQRLMWISAAPAIRFSQVSRSLLTPPAGWSDSARSSAELTASRRRLFQLALGNQSPERRCIHRSRRIQVVVQ